VHSRFKPRRPIPPLNESSLQELALRYVGKYATTRAKLATYLSRKVRERGWEGREPDLSGLAERMASLGYVDDAAYALGKSRSLTARGFGKRRLSEQLRLAGVEADDGAAANAHADAEAVDAAIRFARRRRIGPFAETGGDPKQREKWIAAMVRGGHKLSLARALASMSPGAEIDLTEFRQPVDSDDLC
jgi:regulatory protein